MNLDQSATSIQILPEPNAGHVTRFYKITTLHVIVSQSGRDSLILKIYKNKLLSPLSELLFQKCIMLEIRYELDMVNSSNLAFSNSLIRFMNKIPMSGLAITLRTMYCYPAIELRPRQKIFVPPQPKNRGTINYPSYLRYMYILHAGYTYY